MLSILKGLLSLINLANNGSFVGKQLKNPNGLFARKVAKSMNLSNKSLYDLIFKNLQLSDQENILEIGFGNGYFFEQLSQKNQNAQLFGVEISKEMIKQCAKLNKKIIADKKLEIKHFDGLVFPYGDEMFDKAIAINLIYFWENPIEHIKELNRILKPDGVLYIGVRPFDVLSHLPFVQENFNIQQDHWWIELFENAGFNLINNQSTTELPLRFNGKTYQMAGACWVFRKSKHIISITKH